MTAIKPLATFSAGRITFDKAAIMRRAYEIGRHALKISHVRREPAAERYAMMSRFLTRAWAEAKAEAAHVARTIDYADAVRASLAERAKASLSIAATFGNDPEAIRAEILSETMRDHFDGRRLDRLTGALSALEARS